MKEKELITQYDNENIRFRFEEEMFLARQRYPRSLEESYAIVDEVAELARSGKHIALVDGSFDVPHPNHQWYLQHCRLLAAKNHFALLDRDVDNYQELAACDDVVLIVALDTDARVAGIKGNNPEKGSCVKPVYPWEVRAQFISNFMTPTTDGRYRPVVDIVTIDGFTEEYGTPHESHLAFGAALVEKDALHSWLFYGEHDTKREEAERIIMSAGSTVAQTTGIIDGINYCLDERGEPWHSSSIIKKIQGQ